MGRAPCCNKEGIKKGPWTPEEDQKLIQYIQIHGAGNWRNLPKNAGLQRCGKSCRLRWANYLRPDIKRGRFSFEEEETIIQLHSVLGNKWSAIAARLPGRTDNEIKNYWNTHIRKRLLRMGIDPVTHSPRLDFMDLSSVLSSAQLNLSNLLGLQNLINPQLLLSLLQKLQENQLLNDPLQNHPPPFQPHQLQSAPLAQELTAQGIDRAQLTTNYDDLSSQTTFLENILASGLDENLPNLQDRGYMSSGSERNAADISDNSALQSMNSNGSSSSSQGFTFDSLVSTPMSSPTALNSLSTLINGGNGEDDRGLLKFEIPEGLNFDDFL
ncbi:hypothetical protein NMG60_11035521 [Bertholletia excelsa]